MNASGLQALLTEPDALLDSLVQSGDVSSITAFAVALMQTYPTLESLYALYNQKQALTPASTQETLGIVLRFERYVRRLATITTLVIVIFT